MESPVCIDLEANKDLLSGNTFNLFRKKTGKELNSLIRHILEGPLYFSMTQSSIIHNKRRCHDLKK